MSTELQEMLSLSFSVCGVKPQGCLKALPGLTPDFARLALGMREGVPILRVRGCSEGYSLTRTRLVPGMLGNIRTEAQVVGGNVRR